MLNGMLHLHNFLRWVVIILAVWAIIRLITGKNRSKVADLNNQVFTKKDRTPNLIYMIVLDIQLLIGFYLYFVGGAGLKSIQNLGMGEVMKNSVLRFFAIEHTIGMLIAIILAHVANGISKKNMAPVDKYSKMLYLTLGSIILILLSIPWPFREAARPLFPGM